MTSGMAQAPGMTRSLHFTAHASDCSGEFPVLLVLQMLASCKAVMCKGPTLASTLLHAAYSLRDYIDEENQKFNASCSEFEVCLVHPHASHSSMVSVVSLIFDCGPHANNFS